MLGKERNAADDHKPVQVIVGSIQDRLESMRLLSYILSHWPPILALFLLGFSNAQSQVLGKKVTETGLEFNDFQTYKVTLEIEFRVKPVMLKKDFNESFVTITVEGIDSAGFTIFEKDVRDKYSSEPDAILDLAKNVVAKRIEAVIFVPKVKYRKILKWDARIGIWMRK
ncbi:MAG: hypothetical protein KF749_13310 [Bacteroidetes bacterium]|nr:hypothetical protein [Bacteroidota bacterium]MCW5894328.1 hypothetical protein [Bacteroidota bacterium]